MSKVISDLADQMEIARRESRNEAQHVCKVDPSRERAQGPIWGKEVLGNVCVIDEIVPKERLEFGV